MANLAKQRDEKGNKTAKVHLIVEGYHPSDPIDLRNIGTSGIIALNSLDWTDYRQLQFGISISLGPTPFNKTTFLTIVPRYIVINKMKHPVLIR